MTLISNELLSIVQMNKGMYIDVYKNSLDEDLRKFVPDEVFDSEEKAKKALEQIIENYKSKEGPFVYAIIRNIDNKNLGYVELVKINNEWEIGYHIVKEYTGKGYATTALSLFISYINDNTDIKELYGIVLKENIASRRTLEKCGFNVIYEDKGIYQGFERDIVKSIKTIK